MSECVILPDPARRLAAYAGLSGSFAEIRPPVPSRQRSSQVGRIRFEPSEIHAVTAGPGRAKIRPLAVFGEENKAADLGARRGAPGPDGPRSGRAAA
jgi:hypothetical protein